MTGHPGCPSCGADPNGCSQHTGPYPVHEDHGYDSAEAYIHGEYGGELPIIRAILDRFQPQFRGTETREAHDAILDRLALQIVGYYTGCLGPSGTPRVGRRGRL